MLLTVAVSVVFVVSNTVLPDGYLCRAAVHGFSCIALLNYVTHLTSSAVHRNFAQGLKLLTRTCQFIPSTSMQFGRVRTGSSRGFVYNYVIL